MHAFIKYILKRGCLCMYDYTRNSLYESEEKDEMEKLRSEIEKEIIKDEVNNYNKKLKFSVEVEKYYMDKLKGVSQVIVELKEKSRELNELKGASESLTRKSELNPKDEELKEQALDVEEEYYQQLDDFVDKVSNMLKVDLSELVSKHQIDHTKLISVLKEYRTKIKEEIETQKTEREKIMIIMEKGIYNKFDSELGKEISNILKNEIKTYNEDIQNDLKKCGLHETEEVLLKLKMLISMYGYKKADITVDFIQKEMEEIKNKIKLYIPIYKNIKNDLKTVSESKISELKLIIISEAKEEIEIEIDKLEERQRELKEILQKDDDQIEIEELKSQNRKRKIEIEELGNIKRMRIKKFQEDTERDVHEIEEDIKQKQIEIEKNDKRLNQLQKKEQSVIMLGDLGTVIGLDNLQFMLPFKSQDEIEDKIEIESRSQYEKRKSEDERLDVINAEDEPYSEEGKSEEENNEQEYILLTLAERKEIYNELKEIGVKLKEMKEKEKKFIETVELTKSAVEKYEDLKEEQDDKKNFIIEELSKYDVLKGLTEAFDRSKNASYKHLYI